MGLGKAVSWPYFEKALKAIQPKAVLMPSKESRGAMVYIRAAKWPDVDHRGLWEVAAVPSPTFFRKFPKVDFSVEGQTTDKGKWMRGYVSFWKLIAKKRGPNGDILFPKRSILKWFPDAFVAWDHKTHRVEVSEALKPAWLKQYDKMKQAYKPIADWGKPVDWKRNQKHFLPEQGAL